MHRNRVVETVGPGVICPQCRDAEMVNVVCYGLPMRLCLDPACSFMGGFWAFIFQWVPFNGWFVAYKDGHYWGALWHWLTHPAEEDE